MRIDIAGSLRDLGPLFFPGTGARSSMAKIFPASAAALRMRWRTPGEMRGRDEAWPTFAQLFFSRLPEEQARSQLALMVTALLEEAEQRLAERSAGPDAA
jgi:hypothetical protein